MRVKTVFVTSILVAILTGSSFAWRETEISKKVGLPPKIEITTPDPNLPKEIAAFSGRWEGIWEAERRADSILIVEKINEREAKVIYAASFAGGGEAGGKYFRFTARIIQGGIPQLEFSSQYSKFVFVIGEDLRTLYGTREADSARYGRHKDKVKMQKIEEE